MHQCQSNNKLIGYFIMKVTEAILLHYEYFLVHFSDNSLLLLNLIVRLYL